MTGNRTEDEYKAEISMLSHEIYQLRTQLEQSRAEQEQRSIPDKYNPFGNPTDYPDYSGDYSEIVPQITEPGCTLPVEPAKAEKKKLRRFYSIGGTCMLLHWGASAVLSTALVSLIMLILQLKNPDASYDVLYDYAYGTSIVAALTMLTYLIVNVGFAFMGLKWSKTPVSSLLKTRDFTFGKAFQYCFAAVFIQYAASLFSTALTDIIGKYGFSADVMNDSELAQNGLGITVMIIYGCIIAPVTEELFYRGMLLKTFSRANQRFGIIASSVFFGLAHGNIAQFMLAFLLGIFLSHIDLKHNSLIPSIIVHIFINTIATVINNLYDENDVILMGILNMIYLAMMILGVVMLIEFSIRNKLPRTTPHQSRRGFAVAKTSIPSIFAFGIQVIYMVLLIFSNPA